LLVFLIRKLWILVLIWLVIPLYIFLLLLFLTPNSRRISMHGEGRLKDNASRLARTRASGFSRNG
jgi:hypothetical protein